MGTSRGLHIGAPGFRHFFRGDFHVQPQAAVRLSLHGRGHYGDLHSCLHGLAASFFHHGSRGQRQRYPERVVEARSEIEAFKRALAELPPRPREVLRSISIEGQSPQEFAARLKVSIRTVESDLRLALGHCADSLEYKLRRRLGGPRPRS